LQQHLTIQTKQLHDLADRTQGANESSMRSEKASPYFDNAFGQNMHQTLLDEEDNIDLKVNTKNLSAFDKKLI